MKHKITKLLLISIFSLLAILTGLYVADRRLSLKYGYSVIERKDWKVVYSTFSHKRAIRKYEELNSSGIVVILQDHYEGNAIIPW